MYNKQAKPTHLITTLTIAIHRIVLLVFALDARPVVGTAQLRIGRSVRLLGVGQQLKRTGRRVAVQARLGLGENGTSQLGSGHHKVLDFF